MIDELIRIIECVKEKITDNSDVVWTDYDTARQIRQELETYIGQLKAGDFRCMEELERHFAPTSTLQEHSISNAWADEYLLLSKKFDALYYGSDRSPN